MKKFKKLLLIALCFVFVLLAGCRSSVMMGVQPMNVANLDENSVIVNFVRPSFYGGAIQFGLWDSEEWIGISAAGSYIQYKTTPGKHLFLARAENWSCVQAELEGGRSYFILASPRMGAWKARVSLEPVNIGDNISEETINKWLTDLNAITIDPAKSQGYVEARIEHVRQAIANIEQGKAKCNTLSLEDYR
ncbi:MAG: hypothetical protein K8R67_16375 [Desulfobacteraceae bacterium]|nr:hypothetical protein [Desulfobacteraceae bacterium]